MLVILIVDFNLFTYLCSQDYIDWAFPLSSRGRHGRDCMIVGFTTCAISATNIVRSNPAQAKCTRYNIICDKICQLLATGQWFSSVSSTNKTDCHNITEILLKVALNVMWYKTQMCSCQELFHFWIKRGWNGDLYIFCYYFFFLVLLIFYSLCLSYTFKLC